MKRLSGPDMEVLEGLVVSSYKTPVPFVFYHYSDEVTFETALPLRMMFLNEMPEKNSIL